VNDGGVLRVGAADVLPPASLKPPTAETFEELEIPASYREAVEKELSAGEKLLWVGRPSRNPELNRPDPMFKWMSRVLIPLGVVIIVAALAFGGGNRVFGCIFGGVLTGIGLLCLLPGKSMAKSFPSCYAVTNRRAMLVEMSAFALGGPAVQSYQPQQLLGMERRDHESVPGAGDLIFEQVFALAGNNINQKTGGFLQQGPGVGLSNAPQRVARGFLSLDHVGEVEDLIRTTMLLSLEQTLDAKGSGEPVRAACACGATLEAPAALTGKSVRCPRCAAAVVLGANEGSGVTESAKVVCRRDEAVPADLEAKTLAGLASNEKPVWVGRPVAKLVLLRSGGYLAGSAAGMLVAVLWLLVVLMPPRVVAPRPQPGNGKQAAVAAVQPAAKRQAIDYLLPVGLFLVSAAVSAVALVRWKTATRTCYALTNRRALVYKESPFGVTRETYSPLEVSDMKRSNSWLGAGQGDLIFKTVQVVTTSRSNTGKSSTSVRTIHYGFLAIAHVAEVQKVVHETLIDPFVDRLTQASALR
jgi:hypothetical protein